MSEIEQKPLRISRIKLQKARGKRKPVETAHKLGISYQYLWQIEKGKRGIDGDLLLNMCHVYGIRDIMRLAE